MVGLFSLWSMPAEDRQPGVTARAPILIRGDDWRIGGNRFEPPKFLSNRSAMRQ